jgi:hypothetical protein
VTCEVSTHLGVRLQVVVNGHMDRGQRKDLMVVNPFRNSGVEGVGAPCIESSEVAKRDAPFRLSLWSRVVVTWRRIREELACARPL